MANVHTTWVPKKRNIFYQLCPVDIPEWVYIIAQNAKRFYNEDWEFWVWNVAQDYNVSQAEAEDACIRGIKKEILRMYLVWGNRVGRWFEEYLDMNDIFDKVKHPEYVNRLSTESEVKDGTI